MTRSVYGPLENGTLSFQIATGYLPDSYTGEPVAQVETHSYRCNLRSAKVPQRIALSGIDRLDIYLEGTLLEPDEFEEQIVPGMIAAATYQGRTGQAELLPSPEGYPVVSSLTRERFAVLFRQVGGGAP